MPIIVICKLCLCVKYYKHGEYSMKGIILAGGTGSRLYPMTQTVSKQLLPVYDKPMIYYPLATLMLLGISEILIISTPCDLPNIEELLGSGDKLGLSLSYKVQPNPDGIAQAFILAEEFIRNKAVATHRSVDNCGTDVEQVGQDDDVCLILGDNIFYLGGQYQLLRTELLENQGKNASIFAYHVSDPERFGVVEFDENHKVISIEEKPSNPKSNYALVGLYFYPSDVVEKAKTLRPSARGEYEITDLNNLYLKEERLNVIPLRRGNAWLDAGTPDSLMAASSFVQIVEKRQGLKIACIEEIAYRRGFIDDKQMQNLIDQLKDGNSYKDYLKKVYREYHELY